MSSNVLIAVEEKEVAVFFEYTGHQSKSLISENIPNSPRRSSTLTGCSYDASDVCDPDVASEDPRLDFDDFPDKRR